MFFVLRKKNVDQWNNAMTKEHVLLKLEERNVSIFALNKIIFPQ